MRTQNSILNSASSVLSHVFLIVLGFYVRKLFLENFDIRFLGYEGLFGSMFTVLSVAELGAGGMITYRLYRAFENNDTKEVGVLIEMLKQLYFILGCFILLMGVVLYFFIPALIKESITNWDYVRLIYIVQISTAVCTYFLAYRRTVLLANQYERAVVKIETILRTANIVWHIIAILIFRDYMLYIISGFVTTLISNILIAIRYRSQYCNIPKFKISRADYKQRNIGSELRNLFTHKVSATIYSSTDNILISAICGIHTVALYSNYLLINLNATNIIVKTLQPLEASVGSKVYSNNLEENRLFFDGYDMFSQLLATLVFGAFTVLFQPTIELLFGTKYLLPFPMVCALAANNYISVRQYAITAYRNALGQFHIDRNYRIASAVLNVALSFALGTRFGVSGIIASTAIGHLFIWIGRIKVVGIVYFKNSSFQREIWLRELVVLAKNIVLVAICMMICNTITISIVGLLLRILVCGILPLTVDILIYRKTARFVSMCYYIKKLFSVIFQMKTA